MSAQLKNSRKSEVSWIDGEEEVKPEMENGRGSMSRIKDNWAEKTSKKPVVDINYVRKPVWSHGNNNSRAIPGSRLGILKMHLLDRR